jgi:hypothetical protein
MDSKKIKIISEAAMNSVVEKRKPVGLYLSLQQDDSGTPLLAACDNSTGDAYVEDFHDLAAAVGWLRGEEKDNSDKVAVSAEKVRQTTYHLREMERVSKDEDTPAMVRNVNAAAAEATRFVLRLLGIEVH